MFKKGTWYAIVAILVVVTLLAGCTTRECDECVQSQGLSHMTGPIDIGPGTAAAPAVYFNADSNTGIYQPAADQWGIAVAGSQVLGVSASGPAWTGAGFDVNVTGAASIDADLASNFSVAVGDLTLEAETGSVVIKGDEAAADAITLDANDAAGTGISAVVGSAGTFGVTGYIADLNMTGGVSIDADLASNFSTAAGDITIDAEAASVNIIGSEANAAAIYLDANDTVTSGVDVDTGTTSGLTIDGGPFSVDGTGAFNINTASGDITVEAETGSVTLKGDEGAADAIHLDADETALGGVTIAANTGGVDVNLTAAGPFAVDGDLFVVGNAGADGDVADADNDMLVVGVLEVDGELECDGTADFDAAMTAVTTTIGTDGVGMDVIWHSLESGDELTWDASAVCLDIEGTDSQDAVDVIDGDLNVADNIDVGATAYINALDVDGGDITMQNDETLSNSQDTVVTATIPAAGYFVISGGNFKVGNGAPDVALGGEDAYVEGTFETDGTVRLDGAVTMNSTLEVNGNITLENDETLVNSQNGVITYTATTHHFAGNTETSGSLDVRGGDITLENDETLSNSQDKVITATVPADGYFSIATGNFSVGSYGSADQTLNGVDAYIEGLFEVDGVAYLDGGAECNGTFTMENDETLVNSQDTVITATIPAAGYFVISGGNLKVGNGAPDVALGGEDAYVEGTFEADGTVRLDGAVTMNSTLEVNGNITLENDETISNSSNGVVQIGGFLALTEGAVQVMTYGCTLTAVASFQPITSTAVITNVIIADGTVGGQIVVISNENAADDVTILEAGSNLQAGGDVTLTGGAKDLLTLLWDGAEWNRLAFFDN